MGRGRRREEEEVEADDDGWLYSYRGVDRARQTERGESGSEGIS